MSTNFKGAIIGGIYPDSIGLDYFSYYSCPKLDQYDFIVFHPDLISDLPDDGIQVENDNWIAEPFNFLNISARNLFWQTTLLELLARGSNLFYVLDPFFHRKPKG
ncbi:hypothetical protein [Kangiella shandongensis]|uniref:hypothetical protein n=1 Tax=Kangiella shandongensis TaxID=2763258 RepID=UPI001CBD13E5|nr:hypothetical protein [Kangiella shandongensis]